MRKRGRSWQVPQRENGGVRGRRGRLVSQMAGLFVWAAWHGEGSLPSV